MLHSRRASKESAMSRSISKPRSASHRLERVGELIRHAVADILARGEVRDEAFDRHPLTIPAVRMSPDLKLATILVMPLGGKGAGATVEALDRHKKELRALVARRINLKFAPDLRFALDTSFDAQARMDELLRSPAVARDLKDLGGEDKE
jgi:ribosome-binding factor A